MLWQTLQQMNSYLHSHQSHRAISSTCVVMMLASSFSLGILPAEAGLPWRDLGRSLETINRPPLPVSAIQFKTGVLRIETPLSAVTPRWESWDSQTDGRTTKMIILDIPGLSEAQLSAYKHLLEEQADTLRLSHPDLMRLVVIRTQPDTLRLMIEAASSPQQAINPKVTTFPMPSLSKNSSQWSGICVYLYPVASVNNVIVNNTISPLETVVPAIKNGSLATPMTSNPTMDIASAQTTQAQTSTVQTTTQTSSSKQVSTPSPQEATPANSAANFQLSPLQTQAIPQDEMIGPQNNMLDAAAELRRIMQNNAPYAESTQENTQTSKPHVKENPEEVSRPSTPQSNPNHSEGTLISVHPPVTEAQVETKPPEHKTPENNLASQPSKEQIALASPVKTEAKPVIQETSKTPASEKQEPAERINIQHEIENNIALTELRTQLHNQYQKQIDALQQSMTQLQKNLQGKDAIVNSLKIQQQKSQQEVAQLKQERNQQLLALQSAKSNQTSQKIQPIAAKPAVAVVPVKPQTSTIKVSTQTVDSKNNKVIASVPAQPIAGTKATSATPNKIATSNASSSAAAHSPQASTALFLELQKAVKEKQALNEQLQKNNGQLQQFKASVQTLKKENETLQSKLVAATKPVSANPAEENYQMLNLAQSAADKNMTNTAANTRMFQPISAADEAQLENELREHPDHWFTYTRLAKHYQMQHRLTDAERVLRKLVSLDPENTDGLAQLATVYGKEGQWELAEKTLASLLSQFSSTTEIPMGLFPDIVEAQHQIVLTRFEK